MCEMELRSTSLFVVLVLIGSLRIVATYDVFNHTFDEPSHILCGMEWLDRGTYRLWPEQPPLARVAVAIGPYLAGRRFEMGATIREQSIALLAGDKHYDRNLALARLGNLPFFWIASAVVFFWAKRFSGPYGATAAVFLFTWMPPVLAHAGLATTDMALTAFLGLAFITVLTWLESPSWKSSLAFGAAAGLAVLSKLSALSFFPASVLAALVCYLAVTRPALTQIAATIRTRLPTLCLAVAVTCLVVWAGYRFSYGEPYFSNLHGAAASKPRIPAPELYDGLLLAMGHNQVGHSSYLLGKRNSFGFWYYYPVVLFFKTPLPFLALLLIGTAHCLVRWRRRVAPWMPLAFSLGILLFSLSIRINIGIRHVLPVYIGFSIVAAFGIEWLAECGRSSRWAGGTLAVLLAWFAASSVLSHPDYLPYFNFLAGSEPEKIVADSDLDWGQDTKRLARRLKELGATHVAFMPFVPGAEILGLPPFEWNHPTKPSPGWNAVSLSNWKVNRLGLEDRFPEVVLWPDKFQPVERVGKGILLYYFPPPLKQP
jgi:4-amino-4-deoxy-L-arabinose transferase-like glycosyltransferase